MAGGRMKCPLSPGNSGTCCPWAGMRGRPSGLVRGDDACLRSLPPPWASEAPSLTSCVIERPTPPKNQANPRHPNAVCTRSAPKTAIAVQLHKPCSLPPNELRDGWRGRQAVGQPGSLRLQVPWAELWKLSSAERVGNQRPFLPASGPRAEAQSVSSSSLCDPGEGIPSLHL